MLFSLAPKSDLFGGQRRDVQFVFFPVNAQGLLDLCGFLCTDFFHRVVSGGDDVFDPFLGNAGCEQFGAVVLAFHVPYFGAHLGEEQYILDGRGAGHHHHQAIDADADTSGRRHAVFEGAQEILVDVHRFVVAALQQGHLRLEAFALIDRVVQLGVAVGHFLAGYHQFEAFGELGIVAVAFGQRRHFDRVVGDEGRLDHLPFGIGTEEFVDELAFAHRVVYLDVELAAGLAQSVFIHSGDVHSGVFPDGIGDGHAAERCLEADAVFADLRFGRTVDGRADSFEQLFGHAHHPQIVLVRDVEFHDGKLGVVRTVHALVAEVARKLVNPFEAAHDQAFEVQLVGNTQVERDVQGVVVRDEGTSRCTARDGLQHGRFHFQITAFVEKLAHGVDDLGALEENVLHPFVDDQVHVTLAVALLGIGKGVVHIPVLILFHHRQRAERFGQHGELVHVNRFFSRSGAEYGAFYADEVADVE